MPDQTFSGEGTYTYNTENINTLQVALYGVSGDDGSSATNTDSDHEGDGVGSGGNGGLVEGELDVSGVTEITIHLGGRPSSPLNNGGSGGDGGDDQVGTAGDGGDGGGESAIVVSGTKVAISEGGGGGAGENVRDTTFGNFVVSAGGGGGGARGGSGGSSDAGSEGSGVGGTDAEGSGAGGDGGDAAQNDPGGGGDGGTATAGSWVSGPTTTTGGSGKGSGTAELTATDTALSQPSNVAADALGTDVSLQWDDGQNEDGYRVYRTTVDSPTFPDDYSEIADLAADSTSYIDSNLSEGTQYHYAVTAYATNVETDPGTDSATTVLPAPDPPTLTEV